MKKKINIAILGSTGSIGRSSIEVINKHPDLFNVELLSCYSSKKILINQIKKFLPKYVIIGNSRIYEFVKKINFKKKIIFFNSLDNFNKIFKGSFDKTILAISSINGLPYAFSFLNCSKEILLANKETIVCGGNFFLREAKRNNCIIKSIDSEHYCLSKIIEKIKFKQINKIYLTASGGPFLHKSKKQILKSLPSEAMRHPNWKMGKKISIDSATMVNKGLEVIEASILFKLNPSQIKIKIHEESKVHSAVLLKNNLVYLVAHDTSMKIPIENSLLDDYKNNQTINFFEKKNKFIFSFDEINLKKFLALPLAFRALTLGQRACIFYNVINDCLVNMYLERKIFFYEITSKLNKVMSNKKLKSYFKKKVNNLNDIYDTINYAKSFI